MSGSRILQNAQENLHFLLIQENAWTLYNNSDTILNDPRMFFAPINIHNGLAYFGEIPNPTVGVYVEWWMKHPEGSIDEDGSLNWFISGSPLSGANGCMSVNQEGLSHRISKSILFSNVWETFADINKRYSKEKKTTESYTFEEVLIKLRGEEYSKRLNDLREEQIGLETLYGHRPPYGSSLPNIVRSSQKTTLNLHQKEIKEFFRDFIVKEDEMYRLKEMYEKQESDLKQQLKEGRLSSDDFILTRSKLFQTYLTLLKELSEQVESFMESMFGSNPTHLYFIDVLRYARKKLTDEEKDR